MNVHLWSEPNANPNSGVEQLLTELLTEQLSTFAQLCRGRAKERSRNYLPKRDRNCSRSEERFVQSVARCRPLDSQTLAFDVSCGKENTRKKKTRVFARTDVRVSARARRARHAGRRARSIRDRFARENPCFMQISLRSLRVINYSLDRVRLWAA